MLNFNRLKAIKKSNIKPKYIICDVFPREYNTEKYKPYIEITRLFKLGYKPNEIFILAPSIKSLKSPVRLFENYLKKNNPSISIYVPSSDEEKIDPDVIQDKLIFSTFHQSKGLERKVVIIFGFDESYFKFYKKDNDNFICSNELYVATTRAKEELIMIHHYQNNYLPFLNKNKLTKFCIIEGKLSKNIDELTNKDIIKTSATDIVKHLPQEIIDKCFTYFRINNIRKGNKKISIISKIKNKSVNTCESVSEINGLAIPAYFEYKINKKMSILEYCKNPPKDLHYSNNNVLKLFWKERIGLIKWIEKEKKIKDNLLQIATIYNSLHTGYIFKSFQIEKFNWLSKNTLDRCLERLYTLNISSNSTFEYVQNISNISNNYPELLNRILIGIYDCIDTDNNIIYEFKCTKKLEKEHYIQLAIYMYIHMINQLDNNIKIKYRYRIYNILTDQLDEITTTLNQLKKLIKYIFDYKFGKKEYINDINFIENCLKIQKKIK